MKVTPQQLEEFHLMEFGHKENLIHESDKDYGFLVKSQADEFGRYTVVDYIEEPNVVQFLSEEGGHLRMVKYVEIDKMIQMYEIMNTQLP